MIDNKLLDGPCARDDVRGIALDAVAHLGLEDKRAALDAVNRALDAWKLAQAAADGTVILPIMYAKGSSLGVLATRRPNRKHVPIGNITPQQCAGVRSAAELFIALSLDEVPEVTPTRDRWGLCAGTALLLERDAMTMPVGSLVFAVRTLWMYAWVGRQFYYRNATATTRYPKIDQLVSAQLKSVVVRTADARAQHEDWRRRAREIRREHPNWKRETVADEIRKALIREGDEHPPSMITIRDQLKGLFRPRD